MEVITKIYSRFPNVKKKANNMKDPNISLTTQESVFFQLTLFFKNPELHQFSINMLYEHLQDEDLIFSMQMMIEFFQKETTLIRDVSQSFYDSQLLNSQIVGQKRFSEMVEKAIPGIKFRASMINVYWSRGSDRIPRPDLIIDGTPYWLIETIQIFIKEEKAKKRKADKQKKE